MIIANKYELLEKLNSGSFGTVYKGKHVRTGELVAIKIERKSITSSLKNEAKICQYLAKEPGFLGAKWYQTDEHYTYLVINLLVCSLTSLIKIKGSLPLNIILKLGIQMIKRIETLHSKYLLHRDVKPDNFMLNKNKTLYLIDYGLCKRYDHDGRHIEQAKITSIIGSVNFVSLNVHKGCEPSRRDDLESCLYVMIYMLFGKFFSVNGEEPLKILILKKEQLTNIPRFLTIAINYVRTLRFEEEPDYKYIIRIFSELLEEQRELEGYSKAKEDKEDEQDDEYEWS